VTKQRFDLLAADMVSDDHFLGPFRNRAEREMIDNPDQGLFGGRCPRVGLGQLEQCPGVECGVRAPVRSLKSSALLGRFHRDSRLPKSNRI
jgi:hypothetical protein